MSFLRTSLVTFVLASISLFGCANPESNETSETGDNLRSLRNVRVAHLPTYYVARLDPRGCTDPVCSGISISAANQKITQCARGTYAKECAISDLDLSGFGDPTDVENTVLGALGSDLETTRVVFLGTIVPTGSGISRLQVQMAWVALDERVIVGDFFDTRVNGVVCVAAPCPSYDQEVLNRGEGRMFHGFDFSALPIHANDSTYTTPGLYSDYGLIVSGENVVKDSVGPAGPGTFLKASQVFVPMTISDRTRRPRREPPTPSPLLTE